MVLSDKSIKEALKNGLVIKSKYNMHIGPASVDFHLGNIFKRYLDQNIVTTEVSNEITLQPGDFVLGATDEYIEIPYNLVARCEGRSSIGRLGVAIHITAGYIDPGFKGTITLEIKNMNNIPITLKAGQRVGQFAFETVLGEVENTYDKIDGSKYMNQILPEESRYMLDQ